MSILLLFLYIYICEEGIYRGKGIVCCNCSMIRKWLLKILRFWIDNRSIHNQNPVKDSREEIKIFVSVGQIPKRNFSFSSVCTPYACTSFPEYPTPFSLDPVIL